MKRVVIGTAGHIDHGKTTLVKALTGIETDRLKEEKQRGISIELGFAPFTLPDGQRAAIVDVPGHERFIKHMLAGAFGIDMVVFVIAADEGVMPQTKEHMDIIQLLGIKNGIIVITKKDMVDEEWLMLVEEEVKEYIADTILKNAPVLAVSAVSGEGIDELLVEIKKIAEKVEEKSAIGKARIPIDRVFTKAGFGTVITGTLWSGQLKTGEMLELLPVGKEVRIRTLQVHNDKVATAYAGQRVAVNLQGIEVSDIHRGYWLASPGFLTPTYRMDARLRLLHTSPRTIKNWNRVRFHLGTDEAMARIVLLDRDELLPGDEGFVQIIMEKPVVGFKGDPFVLRYYSPITTIGGGTIIDSNAPKQKRFREDVLHELSMKEEGSLAEVILFELEANPEQVISIAELGKRTGSSVENLQEEIEQLLNEKKVVAIKQDEYISSYGLEHISEKVRNALQKYHRQFPLRRGLPREEIRSRYFKEINTRNFNQILKFIEQSGEIKTGEKDVMLPEHKPEPAAEDKAVITMIKTEMENNLFSPPTLTDLQGKVGMNEEHFGEIVSYLQEENCLVKVSGDMYFSQKALDEARTLLDQYFAGEPELTLATARDIFQTSRKYTLPLIEYFDRIRYTRRVGDIRIKSN